jgi:predicted metal-dependent hydrolase
MGEILPISVFWCTVQGRGGGIVVRALFEYAPQHELYFLHFHTDYNYFLCHELGEDLWKKASSLLEKDAWLVMTKVAVVMYHWRRGAWSGAKKVWQDTQTMLADTQLIRVGIDEQRFFVLWEMIGRRIASGTPYAPLELPICDKHLLDNARSRVQYMQQRKDKHFPSWMGADTAPDAVRYMHRLRDRSGVIAARQRALKQKKSK